MPKHKLSTRQIVTRTLIMLLAIFLVSWFMPRNESFRYEYEIGKPWRYGRLSAPYDFPIYRTDSAVMQIQDSIRSQIVPRYTLDDKVSEDALKRLHRASSGLSEEYAAHLRHMLEEIYSNGIITGEEQEHLSHAHSAEVVLVRGEEVSRVAKNTLLSERQAYQLIRNDSLYSKAYADLPIQLFLRSNLVPDTTAMRLEFLRLRQQVSFTSGVVLAESRIIDNGEIVTPRTYDILESYRREQQHRRSLSSGETFNWIGRIILVSLLLCGILVFLGLYRHRIYLKDKNIFVIIGSVVIMVILTSLANRMAVGAVYLVPIGIATILLSTFFGSRIAFFGHITMMLLCSFIAPSHYEYIIIQAIVGMVIVFSLKDGLQDRKQLMHTCIYAGIAYIGTYLLYAMANEGSLANFSWPIAMMMLLNAVLLLLSYLIIYMLENLFGFMSGVLLVELCNMGKGLLLRLSQEAPGTFQHSMNVANLSADAAKEIGANMALVRTGALYHDVGKLYNPMLFTENQQGTNPQNDFSTEESVQTIKRHVTDGIAMAEKENLPEDIIDFIRTHHGSSQVRFFYIKWCNEHPDQLPDKDFFSYPGPNPSTKEQAIVMMADKVEASSRSVKEYTRKAFREHVEKIVNGILNEGLLNDADITLSEIQQCKEVFVNGLANINHARIAYPTLNKDTEAAKATEAQASTEAKETEPKTPTEAKATEATDSKATEATDSKTTEPTSSSQTEAPAK